MLFFKEKKTCGSLAVYNCLRYMRVTLTYLYIKNESIKIDKSCIFIDITHDWGMLEFETVMDRPEVNDNYFKVTLFGHHSLQHLVTT